MGLYISSLANIPLEAKRDYFIYLLDYGWSEPLGETLMKNYEQMAILAADHQAVVIRGTNRIHFEDEVLSWHNINGENTDELLPAILITNRHPNKFKESFNSSNSAPVEDDLKMILIPLKKFCKTTTDVASLIDKLFSDIKEKKDLAEFKVAKEIRRGFGKALADAIILEPNFAGLGFNFNKMIEYFQKK
ncbi:MAG: hypothetical protein JWM14_2045 [Chitinophagaceae bacterium]|nr:hypothetical protein [Chitinophagaceae bacterium]